MKEITDEKMQAIADVCRWDSDVVRAYLELGITASDDPQDIANEIEECYQGEHVDDAAFARHIADESGAEIGTAWPHYCIDWEYAARELMYDYSEQGGHYFRNV
jgi:hypothetical protein